MQQFWHINTGKTFSLFILPLEKFSFQTHHLFIPGLSNPSFCTIFFPLFSSPNTQHLSGLNTQHYPHALTLLDQTVTVSLLGIFQNSGPSLESELFRFLQTCVFLSCLFTLGAHFLLIATALLFISYSTFTFCAFLYSRITVLFFSSVFCTFLSCIAYSFFSAFALSKVFAYFKALELFAILSAPALLGCTLLHFSALALLLV